MISKIIGHSPQIQALKEKVRLASSSSCSVLITGETGTGKELVAKAIHFCSGRSQGPLVCVNCGSIPENLIEDELFGHVKGAYTGADHPRVGRFEQASGGTLFLDEIGNLRTDLQCRLLRVLDDGQFYLVGGSKPVTVDTRIIAATNEDIEAQIQSGKFRSDLYYRLKVFPVHIPPLREHMEDLTDLTEFFLSQLYDTYGIVKTLDPLSIEAMMLYGWPGNVRELRNSMESAFVISGACDLILPTDFPAMMASIERLVIDLTGDRPTVKIPESGLRDFRETIDQLEMGIITQALLKFGGNRSYAAEFIGIKRTTLLERMTKYNIS